MRKRIEKLKKTVSYNDLIPLKLKYLKIFAVKVSKSSRKLCIIIVY